MISVAQELFLIAVTITTFFLGFREGHIKYVLTFYFKGILRGNNSMSQKLCRSFLYKYSLESYVYNIIKVLV